MDYIAYGTLKKRNQSTLTLSQCICKCRREKGKHQKNCHSTVPNETTDSDNGHQGMEPSDGRSMENFIMKNSALDDKWADGRVCP